MKISIPNLENFEKQTKKDRKFFAPAAGFRVADARPTSPEIADVENFEKHNTSPVGN